MLVWLVVGSQGEPTFKGTAEQRDIFDMFDLNHDGVVGKEEFGTIVRALGENPSLKDIDELFSKASGGDSSVTWDQFASSVGPRLSGGNFTQEQIIEMFKVFDKDGDGHVSANEIRSVMAGVYGEPLTEAEIEEIIKLSDVDGDGQINYSEFVRLVLNQV